MQNRCSDSNKCDMNYLRYVGWQETNNCLKYLYSSENIRMMSRKITQLTKGLDSQNRDIIVPDEIICQVIDGIYSKYKPNTGDIFTRLHIESDASDNIIQNIIDQAIEIITSGLRIDYGMEKANESLSAWVQVYGDFNPHGLRMHPVIKVLERRPNRMQFFENY